MIKSQRKKIIEKTFGGTKLMPRIVEIWEILKKIQREQRKTIKILGSSTNKISSVNSN